MKGMGTERGVVEIKIKTGVWERVEDVSERRTWRRNKDLSNLSFRT